MNFACAEDNKPTLNGRDSGITSARCFNCSKDIAFLSVLDRRGVFKVVGFLRPDSFSQLLKNKVCANNYF